MVINDMNTSNSSITNSAVHTARRLGKLDSVLYGAVILLNLMGLTSINSIAEVSGNSGILYKQLAGSIIGILVMTVLSTINYRRFTKYYQVLYGVVILSLAAVLFLGTSGGGARRCWSRPTVPSARPRR